MLGFLLFLLLVWIVISVLGAVLEGLFWLTVVGIVLFLATGAFAWVRRRT